ncbi:MAG: DUF6600 domain-containing protein [Planctomycetota bacterium]
MFPEAEHKTGRMQALKAACACALFFFGSFSLYASEGFEDLVKLIKAGTNEEVLTAFVDRSQAHYALTDDERFFLSDLGLSREMLKYIDEHGKPDANPAPPPKAEEIQQDLDDAPPPETDPPAEEVAEETVVDAPPATETPPDVADLSTFYQTLSPYGCWMKIDGTWYWQPTAGLIHRTWSPYLDCGHWVNSDDGWLWQSGYNWGWGPFHYGRWWRHSRHGWIWMPDTVWAPAWVNWRHSETAIGWAPLPPKAHFQIGVGLRIGDFDLQARHYNFVATAHFCELQLAAHRMPRAQVRATYQDSTLIRNSYTLAGNHIVNHGPSVEHIAEVTHREIPKVRIVDRNEGSPNTLQVHRPLVVATAPKTPHAVVAQHEAVAAKRQEAAASSPFNVSKASVPPATEGRRGERSRAETLPDRQPDSVRVAPRTIEPRETPRAIEPREAPRAIERRAPEVHAYNPPPQPQSHSSALQMGSSSASTSADSQRGASSRGR